MTELVRQYLDMNGSNLLYAHETREKRIAGRESILSKMSIEELESLKDYIPSKPYAFIVWPWLYEAKKAAQKADLTIADGKERNE